jgi:hypothetical protein
LGQVKVLIKVNDAIGTGIYTVLAPSAFGRINNDQAIFSLIDGPFYLTGGHAGCIITMITQYRIISYLYPGNLTSDIFT